MYMTEGNLPDMSDGKVYEPSELLFWVKLKQKFQQANPKKRVPDPMTAHRLMPGVLTSTRTHIQD